MNETFNEKNLNPNLKPLHPTNNDKTMNTTHTMNIGVAIGLAETSNPSTPASAVRPHNPAAASRKTLVLGLLAVASCAVGVLCFKAAVIIGYLVVSLDNLYNSFCT